TGPGNHFDAPGSAFHPHELDAGRVQIADLRVGALPGEHGDKVLREALAPREKRVPTLGIEAVVCECALNGRNRRCVREHANVLGVLVNLSDHVLFLGEQDDIEELMSCAELFILPSKQESFGLVALEAQSFGVPVIGTNMGGLPEVVSHGETGFLLPVGDVEGMAAKALELLESPNLYAAFQKKARERVLDRFDSQMIIPQYEAYYQEILDSRGS
ncbi:MAG: glycosyltransferase, partial [Acidobacteria bacterium]|nr:glycosyltransferase [Acidobacteriota bacterium]